MIGKEPMKSFQAKILMGSILLALTVGCRTAPPELKPPKQPDELNVPPAEARYNYPNWPKEALARDDFAKKKDTNGILPTKGGFGPSGPGGGPSGMGLR
jgi:hypothetical protein